MNDDVKEYNNLCNKYELLTAFISELKRKLYYEYDELIPSLVCDTIDEVAKDFGVNEK